MFQAGTAAALCGSHRAVNINTVYEHWVKLPCARSVRFSKIFIELYPPSIGSFRLREKFSDSLATVSTFATRWQERDC